MSKLGLLSTTDVETAHAAARHVVETHRRLSRFLRIGQTLAEIDRFVAVTLEELGCRSSFLGYKVGRSPAFPSHACLSVNDCIVHGTAASYTKPMKEGDVLKIDVGATFRGWIGDAAWTYVFGEPSASIRRLTESVKEALRRGVKTLRPGEPYINWARVVQRCVEEEYGFHLIRGLGGHGYGRKLHGPPFISNVVPTSPGEWPDAFTLARPGTLVAVEPMVAAGTSATIQGKNEWPVRTADGSISVHYEHDVLIGEDGPIVLTDGLQNVNDVIT